MKWIVAKLRICLILFIDIQNFAKSSHISNSGGSSSSSSSGGGGSQAPNFIQEPPSKIIFSNDTGAQISCLVHGNPAPVISWYTKDGSLINPVSGLRQTLGNGTLYFPPFLGQYYRSDVHEGIYRCRASNLGGTLLSRDVYVRAVVQHSYDVRVDGKDVILGNVAYLKCVITEHARDYVKVASWYSGDEIILPDSFEIGGRYVVTSGNGDLFIRNIRSEDTMKRFSCLTVNSLTGERKLSEPIYLNIKDLSPNTPPKTVQKSTIELSVDRGQDIYLPCSIQSNPLPIFTWYRVSDSGANYPVPQSQRIIPSQSILLVKHSDDRDSGKWICKASNQYGDVTLEIQLFVTSHLSSHIHPQIQVVNSDGTAGFNCSVAGNPIDKIEWFHNGMPLNEDNSILDHDNKIKFMSPVSLVVNRVGRDDRGIYQCIASNARSSTQANAELKLGDTIPELLYTFIEQAVRPGPHISLKCSASGSPPPQFTWLLDTQPIIDVSSLHRYAIGQYVDGAGDVISHLNISHVRTDDGGLYKCVAANSIGNVEHSARLNVYGPPFVRATGPVKAVAGSNLKIYCPFSGHPIDTIRWEKSGQEILSNDRYSIEPIQKGGSLIVNVVDSVHDAGVYTCIVKSRAGDEARRDMQLVVNSPPVIESFNFPKNLPEGGRAQVTCSVSSGDMPVYFSWQKDGAPISHTLQITEKKDEFFTLLILKDITARHSGKYTCFATNSAAKVNHTAELLVRVQPQWTYEPKDTAIMLGHQIVIHCEADGYPIPKITWFKGTGKIAKDFKPLALKNNSLMVDFATASDEGYYMCQANNNIGSGLKKNIFINVNEPARFEVAMKNVSSRRNDPVTLNCNAMGDEPINVVWTHNNGKIDRNNYRLNVVEIKMEDGINSQMSISRADRQDSGRYVCIAENPFGRSEQTIFLAVQERPDSPSNLEVIEVSSRTVKLSWRRPFDGNSPVLSYLVQYQPLSTSKSQSFKLNSNHDWNNLYTVNLTLPNVSVIRTLEGDPREQAIVSGLHPSTTYLLRMLAVNEIEKSEFTDIVVIKTQEEAPMEAPNNVQVQSGGMGELIVSWQVPSRDTWNGELLGYIVNCSEEKSNINYISTNTSSKLLTVNGWATTKSTITNLRKYTRYAVTVRSFNGFGSGPYSPAVVATTLEGVPEAPPQNVTCTGLSSKSIKISWLEPALQFHGGIIQGYKILYRPLAKEMEYSTSSQVKRTSNIETFLHALYKATNYSMRVLAYTSSGDGVSSNPVYCATEEDVPDAPANIKASALTADSIMVSWRPPIFKNGMLTHYTVYMREVGRKGQTKTFMVRVDENGRPVMFEARSLEENHKYEFWVSASTSVGEGEPTPMVTQATNTRAPARIASFSQTIKQSVGTSLILECIAVGNPTPRARWFTRDRAVTFSSFYEVTAEGFLKIHSVELNLSGNYTCSAKNLFGEDEIMYTVIAMRVPAAPLLAVQYITSDSIRLSWDSPNDGGGSIVEGFVIMYRTSGQSWTKVELTPEQNAYTLMSLKCGTQYHIRMTAHNRVGEGLPSNETILWTKGKSPQSPDEKDFFHTNSTCLRLILSAWANGGCSISHYSIEHRPLGEIRWTVVSSYTSSGIDENNDSIIFCDFNPATWYQLKVSATNEAGKTTAQYNFATTRLDGDPIPPPEVFPSENEMTHDDIVMMNDSSGWLSTLIVGIILIVGILLIIFIIRHKGPLCGPISDGYESRVISTELKEDRENRRNQQVYTASPVKTVDKGNESEMYEISPYATFSVAGGRTVAGQVVKPKKPTRGITTSTLDYSVQFKTFGHPDDDDLTTAAYPVLPNSGGFGHVKGKSSWHKQRYYNTDDDSTLSKSMTAVAGGSHIMKSVRGDNCYDTRIVGRNKSKSNIHNQHSGGGDSESDTSASPINEFSNAPTYRIPVKSSRDMFRPDSSTESNNDNSPVHERRSNTPRHISAELRTRSRQAHSKTPRESQSMDVLRPGSNNSSDSEVNIENGLRFCPPSGFTDSKEFSETECDRDRALDLEVQRVMEASLQKIEKNEMTSLLARYQEKKEQERQEYTIHV